MNLNPRPPQPPKKRVTLFVWISLIIDVISDLLKVLMFFFNALPIVGTAVDFAGSILLSIIEICAMASNFFASGLYRSGRGSLANILLTGGIFGVDLIPILDDLPIASVGTLIMIFIAKGAEKQDLALYEQELKKYNEGMANARLATQHAANESVQRAAQVPEHLRKAA